MVGLIHSILQAIYHVFLSGQKKQPNQQQRKQLTCAMTINIRIIDNCTVSHMINILPLEQVTYIMTMSLCISI